MKYSYQLAYIFLIFNLLLLTEGCKHPASPPPLACDCETITDMSLLLLKHDQAVVKWKPITNVNLSYVIEYQNLENQRVRKLKIDLNSQVLEEGYRLDTLTNLPEAASYSLRIQSVYQEKNCSIQKYSAPLLFSTESTTSNCPAPAKLSIQSTNNDTLTLNWYGSPGISQFQVYVVDSSGSIVYQQTVSSGLIGGSQLWAVALATGLPTGSYSVWVESLCNDGESSVPSDLGVFNLNNGGGGGPVVVIEDNIDVYMQTNCSGCKLILPEYTTTSNCLPPQTISFRTGNLPHQLLVGITSPNNQQPECAPIIPNLWRMQSFHFYPIQTHTPITYYQISLPPITCVCPNKRYFTQVGIQNQYVPLSGNSSTVQACQSCQ
ncbi:MAG: hypothetical protein ACKVTZ_02515 [Bacteroidia bacterium]